MIQIRKTTSLTKLSSAAAPRKRHAGRATGLQFISLCFGVVALMAMAGCGHDENDADISTVEQNLLLDDQTDDGMADPYGGIFAPLDDPGDASDPTDEVSSAASVIRIGDALAIPPGHWALWEVPLPEAGLYSITYELENLMPSMSEGILRMQATVGASPPDPANDPILGQVAIKSRPTGEMFPPGDTNFTHTATFTPLPLPPAGAGGTVSTSGTLRFYIRTLQTGEGGGIATPLLREITIAPLRTSDRVDPTTTNFESATPDGAGCSGCHSEQYAQWRSSMMGYSSISPPIHALELTENHVGPATVGRTGTPLGRFARSPGAPIDELHSQQGTSLLCQRCHAPSATFTDVLRVFEDFDRDDDNRGTFPDSHELLQIVLREIERGTDISGRDPNVHNLLREDPGTSGLKLLDLYLNETDDTRRENLKRNAFAGTEGVTCTVCHSMNGIDERIDGLPRLPGMNEEGVGNAGFRVVHNGPNEERLNFGPYDDTEVRAGHYAGQMRGGEDFVGNDGMTRPFIQTSELCGTCHDVRIPQLDIGPNGIDESSAGDDSEFQRVENLFTEWRNSPWNNNGIPFSTSSGRVLANPNVLATTTREPDGTPSGVEIGAGVKAVSTCQDCHMSEYGVVDSAMPGQYAIGAITGGTGTDRRSNHRFMGVDRFLTYERPDITGEPTAATLEEWDVSVGLTNLSAHYAGDIPLSDSSGSNATRDLREILLQKAVDFKIDHVGAVTTEGANTFLPVSVGVENVGAGHNIPSGLSQERQVWIQLEVLAGDTESTARHVFTTGYLNRVKDEGDSVAPHNFDPIADVRYQDSACGLAKEYLCDLDSVRAKLGPFLNIEEPRSDPDNYKLGDDVWLRNYQNGFQLDGEKVFTQFIGNHMDNSNSLKPFVKATENYNVPLNHIRDHADPAIAALVNGPFYIRARLRFRPLPYEFLDTLHESTTMGAPFPSRVTENVIEKNKVIEMEDDACVVGAFSPIDSDVRSCLDTERVRVSAGQSHTCSVFGENDFSGTTDLGGTTQCFGNNSNGQVGVASPDELVDSPTITNLVRTTQTALGWEHSCSLQVNGTVSCWGAGLGGRLADEDTSAHDVSGPRKVDSALLSNVTDIAAASFTTCAVSDGTVKCWGWSNSGELGDGNTSFHSQSTPLEIDPDDLSGVEAIAGGHRHYCAIAADDAGIKGTVKCWGRSVGSSAAASNGTPQAINLPYRATQVVAGEGYSCAALTNDDVYCWGNNEYGTLGANTPVSTNFVATPSLVALPAGVGIRQLTAGRRHACALVDEGSVPNVYCWGDGEGGKLGDGLETMSIVPVQATGPGGLAFGAELRAIAAGGHHTCAVSGSLATGGPVTFCWGRNDHGELGTSDPADVLEPVEVSGFEDLAELGKSYWAAESKGGLGENGCFSTGSPAPSGSCTDDTEFVDVNGDTNYFYRIDGEAGPTPLFVTVGVNSANAFMREMEIFVNGVSQGIIQANNANSARPEGSERPVLSVDLLEGENFISFWDNQGTEELDMIRLRVGGSAPPTCDDNTINQGESDEDCGGPNCDPCGDSQVCNDDNTNCASGICESNVCVGDGPVGCGAGTVDSEMPGTGSVFFVPADSCVELQDNLPGGDFQNTRPIKLQNMPNGVTYSVDFEWANACGGFGDTPTGGSQSITADWDEDIFGGINKDCPTYIQFMGSSTETLKLIYWGN